MKQSEKLHKTIVEIMEEMDCSFWDATMEFCSMNDVDPEDLYRQLDTVAIDRLKADAISSRMVRQAVAQKMPTLEFE